MINNRTAHGSKEGHPNPMDEKHMERLEYIADRVDKIYEAVYGNGNPGLKSEVMLNKDFRCRYQRMFDRLTTKVAGIVIANSLLVGGLVWFLK